VASAAIPGQVRGDGKMNVIPEIANAIIRDPIAAEATPTEKFL
jgi:hypothetical protein